MMRRRLLLSSLFGLLTTCHQVESPEQAATIISIDMPPATALCACCFGYRIQVGTDYYYASTVPVDFTQPSTPVWIRYKADTERCNNTPGRITVISMRSR